MFFYLPDVMHGNFDINVIVLLLLFAGFQQCHFWKFSSPHQYILLNRRLHWCIQCFSLFKIRHFWQNPLCWSWFVNKVKWLKCQFWRQCSGCCLMHFRLLFLGQGTIATTISNVFWTNICLVSKIFPLAKHIIFWISQC